MKPIKQITKGKGYTYTEWCEQNPHKLETYLGNPQVKRHGVSQPWTNWELTEYMKCKKDPAYFAEMYCKVIHVDYGKVDFKLYPYQEKMMSHFKDNRFSIVLACRQSGKCQSINTRIKVKNKNTGQEYELTMGEFHNIAAGDFQEDHGRIFAEGSPQAPALESSHQRDYQSSRQNLREFYSYTSSTKIKEAVGYDREISEIRRGYMLHLWNLYCEIFSATLEKLSQDEQCGLQWTIDRRNYARNLSEKMEWIIKSGSRASGQNVPMVKEEYFCDEPADRRIEKEGCGKQDKHLVSGVLAKGHEWGSSRSREAFERETIDLFISQVCGETWGRDWFEGLSRASKALAEIIEFEVSGRDRQNKHEEEYWKNESTLLQQTRNERDSRNTLCSEVSERDIEEVFLQNWYNIEDCFREILGWEERWMGNNDSDSVSLNVLLLLQDRARAFKTEQENTSDSLRAFPHNRGSDGIARSKLSDSVERKFVEQFPASDWLVWSDTGWEPLLSSNKTVEYERYEVTLENGKTLEVADTHIFFTENLSEIFAKDSEGAFLHTEDGPVRVVKVRATGFHEHMYDLHVNSENHRYYGDGVLSHNSISAVAYLLWYALFHSDKLILILANKGATSKEMLGRITLMLENLPFFLQTGAKALNKGSLELSNDSRIEAHSTSSSSVRGKSASLIYLDEFAFVKDAETFYTSTYPVISSGSQSKVIITSTANGIGNPFYRLWEGAVQKVNDYIPFRVDWWDVPGRDAAWKARTIANTSEEQFEQEFGNCLESCSVINITVNCIKCDIEIGDLYDCYRRKNTSGLSLEEEIRSIALRWDYD